LNVLREKNFNVWQLSHAVHHKAHGHAFGLRVKAGMLLAVLCEGVFNKLLITVTLFVMLYWENSHIVRGRLCFKLNNLTGQKFSMSKLKSSWPVTLTGDPPAIILCPDLGWPCESHVFCFLDTG
jgi:hypothetical protein